MMAKRSPAAVFLWIVAGVSVFAGVGFTVLGIFQQELLAFVTVPSHQISTEQQPPAPDYESGSAWYALPSKATPVKSTPDGIMDTTVMPDVDVFFVHPTTYNKADRWYVPFDDPFNTDFLDGLVMRNFASVFHPATNIYAPLYRQAAIGSFFDDSGQGYTAIEAAYVDVLAAFDNYMATRNEGRPFILAGHSQGSKHIFSLIKDRISGTQASERMITAYIVGWPISNRHEISRFENVHACDSADDTGCIVSWMSYAGSATDEDIAIATKTPLEDTERVDQLCTNPLTWTINSAADAAENIGAVEMLAGRTSLPAPIEAFTGAVCRGGTLRTNQNYSDSWAQYDLGGGNMHFYDYNLFYMNIRENVKTRIAAWKAQQDG